MADGIVPRVVTRFVELVAAAAVAELAQVPLLVLDLRLNRNKKRNGTESVLFYSRVVRTERDDCMKSRSPSSCPVLAGVGVGGGGHNDSEMDDGSGLRDFHTGVFAFE